VIAAFAAIGATDVSYTASQPYRLLLGVGFGVPAAPLGGYLVAHIPTRPLKSLTRKSL